MDSEKMDLIDALKLDAANAKLELLKVQYEAARAPHLARLKEITDRYGISTGRVSVNPETGEITRHDNVTPMVAEAK